jgi:hypothetical protein
VTEGFTTAKYCELSLRDRTRLSKEDAQTICDYIIDMKQEINPRLNTIKTTIQFLYEFCKCVDNRIIKAKLIVDEIYRLEGVYDAYGIPSYQINSAELIVPPKDTKTYTQ